MPKRTDIKKVMVIGSGPIVIGQAAEFDYAGTQACLALKEEGYEVILVNSNPATIMTDTFIADKVYMEPLKLEYVAKIIRYERPDAIVPGLGGQTGLNLAVQLAKKGVLEECGVEILGTSFESIERAEDRELFKQLCIDLGEPVLPSEVVNSIEDGVEVAKKIGYPLVLRPAFTLGGTGGGVVDNEEELRELMRNALALSPVHQVLVEKSIKGYKEIEYEVMRDSNDTAITICNMENVDPVGVHTGDSIVVAPCQTLTDKEAQMLRTSALKIIRELKIEGGCNVQFALDPLSFQYYIIEVNPRVSRSSALASKASGFPIARVTAKVAIGMTLDEIMLSNGPACSEPALDYIVTKIARFPFDKFSEASNELGTQMKATGEVMSIGRTFEESFLKAVRSLETGVCHIYHKKFDEMATADILQYITRATDDRIYAIAELLRRSPNVTGLDRSLIYNRTKIDMFFLKKLKNITEFESVVKANKGNREVLYEAKRMGFGDKFIGQLWGMSESEVFELREELGIKPVYKSIDTCAGEYAGYVPYFYSTYEQENESEVSNRKKIVVLGSGPIRIGQGVEFDYSTVHSIWAIREAGYEAIIINNNPETVSTDYSISDKLYFEPLTVENVMNVIRLEQPEGVIVTLGGQTAINLAKPLSKMGVKVIGTDIDAIDKAEDRKMFEAIMREVGIPQPKAKAVTDIEEGVEAAANIGYPVLVRPSYVLSGAAMNVCSNDKELEEFLSLAANVSKKHPVVVSEFVRHAKEIEFDAVAENGKVIAYAISEHIEFAGVHSGDATIQFPPQKLYVETARRIKKIARKTAEALKISGPFNMQFLAKENDIKVIECNLRASRSFPFVSKVLKINFIELATKVMIGEEVTPPAKSAFDLDYVGIKASQFSFARLQKADPILGVDMASTGEVGCIGDNTDEAILKSMLSVGYSIPKKNILISSGDAKQKAELLKACRLLADKGYTIYATGGSHKYLSENNIPSIRAYWPTEEGNEPQALEMLQNKQIDMVINIPKNMTHTELTNGYRIRRAAVDFNIPLITNTRLASAFIISFCNMTEDEIEIKSWDEYK